ncbi:DNA ligase D [Shinella sumterensis]|uniref:DNA ligase D n=1 Tax=Shinella sumterensis TaxID=1967501 RepID=UPI00106DD364|nr:DNA ligase D [Shinella sumterensis]MCD1262570.1 DNA ligase D [Shinella sumterensis]TFF00119.1 DNA ligase D [Shinella sumterensis]
MATLDVYRQKRDFKTTSEPRGRKARTGGNSFVIQKHDATRLHYDFRLEMDGVLKSWAVTKGPSLVPSEKRLAVHVEDHPLDYGDFEGTIPKGEYGGGTVIVWDRGTWEPIGDVRKAYAKGHLEFTLDGEKLHGRWHLVRMHGKPAEKRENWLLIKGDDEFAMPEGQDDLLEERPESVKTGREIADVAGEEPGWSSKTGRIRKPSRAKTQKKTAKREDTAEPAPDPSDIKGARKATLPDFLPPTLATLASAPPAGERWLHEIKFDGYRLQARIEAGRVKLLTRSGLDWTKKFGKAVPDALRDLPIGTAILDGELVVETGAGASDFSALQADLSAGRDDRFTFYLFDLLYLDGYDLTRLPLEQRKSLLEKLVMGTEGALRYSGHFDENGALVLRHACRLSLEGVVSKLRDAPYRAGRSKGWIKSKCSARQEFVIGGYVPSTVSRKAIGSLVLGVYKKGKLEPVGRVGTGFSALVAEDIFKRLSRLRTEESPFGRKLTAEEARQARYVRPELVAEVEFRAWTADGHLRHASFRGLREDKPAQEVVAEMPKSTKAKAEKAPKPQRRTVRLTHPDRVYWPAEGVTKEGLADYYTEVWRYIAPHIVGRPLALLRAPSGIDGQTFFQKHVWKGINANILQVQDPAEKDDEPYVAINDLDGLMGLVQAAVLEIHPWGSTLADWERPDRIIMDLDPGDGVDWQAVIDAAEETRKRLEAAGLNAFVKTSGGKGLHVCAPLKPSARWPAVKAFCKGIADAMAKDSPGKYVSTITKSKRRGKILIDYLRNQRGMTAVAPYSTRARPGAAVSMPLAWEELGPDIGPAYFTVDNTPTRLQSLKADPWADFTEAARPLKASKQKA